MKSVIRYSLCYLFIHATAILVLCSAQTTTDEVTTTADQTCVIQFVNHAKEIFFERYCDPNKISSMIFKNSHLMEVPDIFRKYNGLKSVDLTNCSIETIDRTSFQMAGNLTTLYMADNNITTIENRVFAGSSKLYSLVLSTCNISILEEEAFYGLASLVKLDLSSNNIVILPVAIFAPLGKLQSIRLNGNQIQTIDGSVFSRNLVLKQIYLRNNNITVFDTRSLVNTTISSLDLKGNPLNEIDLANMKHLQYVTFENANLPVLRIPPNATDVLAPNSNVTMIQLKNDTKYKIERLNLSSNRINDLAQLTSLQTLQVIDISFNNITNFDFMLLKPLKELKQLSLFGNSIKNEINATELMKLFPHLSYLEMSPVNLTETYTKKLYEDLKNEDIYLILEDRKPPGTEVTPITPISSSSSTTPAKRPSSTNDAGWSYPSNGYPYNTQLLDTARDLRKNISMVSRQFSEIIREIEYISQAVNTSYMPFGRLTNLTQQLIDVNRKMLTLLTDASRTTANYEFYSTIASIKILVIVCVIVGLLQIALKYGQSICNRSLRLCCRRHRSSSGETMHPIFEREEL